MINFLQLKRKYPAQYLTGSLTQKAFLNGIASGLDYGARLLVGFIITPILVAGLGDYFYGIWKILERVVSHISSASGRSSKALKWVVANNQSTANNTEKRKFVGSAIIVWLLFLPLLTISGALVCWYIPYFIKTPEAYFNLVRLATAILVAGLAIGSLVEDIPRSVIEGENLGYRLLGRTALSIIIGGLLTWLALYFETGIIGVASVVLLMIVVRGLLYIHIANVCTDWFGWLKPTISEIKRFLGLSWLFMLWNFIMKAMTASDVIILGVLGSATTVTTYTLTKYASETLLTIIATIIFGITPGLGGIIGAGDFKKATLVRNEMMLIAWLFVTCLGPAIVLWNRAFLQLWVDARYDAGTLPTLLIIISVAQLVFIKNDANIIDLTLRLTYKVILGAVSVVISIVAAGLLLSYFQLGIIGLCLGFISGRLILSICYPYMVGRTLGVPLFRQIKALPRAVIVTAALFLFAYKFSEILYESRLVSTLSWFLLILSIATTVCILSVLAFYCGLSSDQRKLIVRRIKLVLSIK